MAPTGEENFSPSIHNHGQTGHFTLYLTDVTTRSHGGGTEGCEISNQWHRRDDNFFRRKSRISITFSGTQRILSKLNLSFLTFSLLSLLQTLDASHLLISTTKDDVLRLDDRPRVHRGRSHSNGVPPG
jgi:hypothetical protein